MKMIGFVLLVAGIGLPLSASAMQVSGASGRATDPRMVGNYGPGTHDGEVRDHAPSNDCSKVKKADRAACLKRSNAPSGKPATKHGDH